MVITASERIPHYVRALVTSTFPKRYAYLDTESVSVDDSPTQSTQTFRIASLILERWSERRDGWDVSGCHHFADALSLWQRVDKFVTASQKTVLWAHNLGYDLRISKALTVLPEMGWQFSVIRLHEDIAWAEVVRVRDGARLVMCDTFSWLPTSLANIAKLMGEEKNPLPDNDSDDIEAWFKRCDHDVEIMADAWRKIHGWLQDNELGPWRMSGPAEAWAIWRRRFQTHKMLVHDDQELLAAEREASYSGRAEAFWHGKAKGKFTEWDYRHSYASTCAIANVPTRCVSPWLKDDSQTDKIYDELERGESAYLTGCMSTTTALVDASVEITLRHDDDIPVLPYRMIGSTTGKPGRVVWPTGTFRGTWWAPELLAAEQSNQIGHVKIHRVAWYRCEPALAAWAQWAIGTIDAPDTDPLIAQLVKQFSRTLVGRFGMRYSEYVPTHVMPSDDVLCGYWLSQDSTEKTRRMMQIGSQVYVEGDNTEGADSCPQVMSYVMMLTRLRLLEAMQAAGGTKNVCYCDTDGLIVSAEGSKRLETYHDVSVGTLRPKAHYSNLMLIGPKQLIIDSRPRIAGLSSKPLGQNADGSWIVQQWERTRSALEAGRPNEVRVRTLNIHPGTKNGRRRERDVDKLTEAINVKDLEEIV